MTRSRTLPHGSGTVDPATVEVFRHRITAVAESMGASLQRAAYSPNIKERLDFSCAVFDASGRLLSQAAHIPVHLGAMPAAVAGARGHIREWHSGDVVALNDPYVGGSHLPDVTTVSPVFATGDAEPSAFVATRAHHADIGGAAPGSLPMAHDLFGEGLVVPPVHLVRDGALQADVLDLMCANSRTPEERRGDLQAQLAAHHTGSERLREIVSGDPARFRLVADALLAYTERAARAQLARLPRGRYQFRDVMELEDEAVAIAVTVDLADGAMHVDFAGTSPQASTGINAPLAVTRSAVYYVVACLVEDVPVNGGTFEGVSVEAPPGCLVHPERPAPVAAGNVETSQRIVDVVLGALSQAAPERVPAASQGTMNNLTVGGHDPRTGKAFTYYETLGGGSGAAANGPGAHAVQVHMTNTRNTPVEALETAYPLQVVRYGVRRGSGGTGYHAGGDGVVRTLRLLAPGTVTLITERRVVAPWGASGGTPGACGVNELHSAGTTRCLPGKVTLDAAAGDELTMRTPGGGGWGEAPEDGPARGAARPVADLG